MLPLKCLRSLGFSSYVAFITSSTGGIVEDGKGRKGLARLLKNAKITKLRDAVFSLQRVTSPTSWFVGLNKSTGAIYGTIRMIFERAADYVDYSEGRWI